MTFIEFLLFICIGWPIIKLLGMWFNWCTDLSLKDYYEEQRKRRKAQKKSLKASIKKWQAKRDKTGYDWKE